MTRRILIVNDYGYINGGVEAFQKTFRAELELRGYPVHVFTSDARRNGPGGANGSAALPLPDSTCFGTTSRFRGLVQSANPAAYFGLRRTIEAFKPDIVHLNDFLTQLSPLILPALDGVPAVMYAQWQRMVCPSGTRFLPRRGGVCQSSPGVICLRERCVPPQDWLPLTLQMGMWRSMRHHVNEVIALSETMRRRLREGGIGDPPVIPYGIRPVERKADLTPHPSVLYTGRLVPEKGASVLLEAFSRVAAKLPEARLHIVGDGPDASKLRAIPNNVSVHGWQSADRIESDFGGCWVQAIPSIWEEPFGLVALEAAARGMAAIVSGHGGLGEIVRHDETGLHVPPGDVDALAEALMRVLSSKDYALRLGRGGREHVTSNFRMEVCIDRWCEVYERLRS